MSSPAVNRNVRHHRVAVVGGGVAGCSVARQLLVEDDTVQVTLFDWGRAVGGRASHRFRPEPSSSDPDKTLKLHFDHGAQFFHATNDTFLEMVRPAVKQWPDNLSRLGWLDSESGKFTSSVEAVSGSDSSSTGLFGACDPILNSKRYVGVGGMNAISNEMLRGATEIAPGRIQVHEGTRVARCARVVTNDNTSYKGWKLFGDGLGHEQANVEALQQSTQQELGEFDEIVVTDHMAAAMPNWHPCHVVGLEDAVPDLVSSLREALGWDESTCRFRTVQPLFSCMVALNQKLELKFDAAAIKGSDVLQWVCCQEGRPHDDDVADESHANLERWVLVSTPEFAARCLDSEGMSKRAPPKSQSSKSPEVEYIPQSDVYLRADPADLMWDAFASLIQASRQSDSTNDCDPLQPAAFLKCQRWGAAFTDPNWERFQSMRKVLEAHENDESITLCGDFIHRHDDDGNQGARFAIQNAAVSGLDAARRIATRMKLKRVET